LRAFKFLHTADLHLGTPFRGLPASIPEAFAAALKAAQRSVFKRIVDVAIEQQVDFVTIAGDLFDQSSVSMSVHFELLRGFERLQECGIRVFVSHGNHDPQVSPPPLPWPDNVFVFGTAPRVSSDPVASTHVDLGADTRVQISGFTYPSADFSEAMAPRFQRQADAQFAIGLYHGNVGSFASHAAYCAATVDELARQNFDFWGLGHIHQPQILRDHSPTVVYPGNPQGRHIREDGWRGCVCVDVAASGAVQLKWIPIAEVSWHEIVVNVDGAVDALAIRDAIHTAINDAITGIPDARQRVMRLCVRGRTRAHGLMRASELQALISEECQMRGLPIWIEELAWQTKPEHNLDVLAESPTVIGEFLRLVRTYEDDLSTARLELLPDLSAVFHAGNELALDHLTDEEVRTMLQDALQQVLQYAFEEEAE